MSNPEDFTRYLQNPIQFPDEFKSWVSDWFATNISKIPISQIYGFKLQSVKTATEITATETTASTTYVNLTTVGPTLENIPNGFYVALWGFQAQATISNTISRFMGLSVDGAAVASGFDADVQVGAGGRVALLDLSLGNGKHTILAKYKVASNTLGFENRWLHLLKVSFGDE